MITDQWNHSIALDTLTKRTRMIAINTIAGVFWLPRGLRAKIYRAFGVTVGPRTHIFPGLIIRPGDVSFGAGCFVNTRCLFDPGSARIIVEDNVFIGAGTTILAMTHEIGSSEQRAGANVSASICISRGSWLGAGVIVLPGVTIGAGCVIGAGSVVTKSTRPNTVYAGVPARILRQLE